MTDLIPLLLLLPTDMGYPRAILEGIRHFAGADKPWRFIHARLELFNRQYLEDHKIRGAIGMFWQGAHVAQIAGVNIPIVNVSSGQPDIPLPQVILDNHAIGTMAAQHFLHRGFRNFGFLGHSASAYSPYRLAAFESAIAAGFGPVHSYNTSADFFPGGATAHDDPIFTWLHSIPRPAAIFAVNDLRGRHLCDLCRQADLRVPEDIAVLGCDNDELMCDLTWPRLSSLELPAKRIGFEAASLLERLMNGEPAPAQPLRLPPLSVVTRQSSDIMALHDQDVARALNFISARAHELINVEDVATEMDVSRRWLEHKFRRALGRTPADEIRCVRLENAQKLLASTDLPMPDIARRVGLRDARRLSVLFRQQLNSTPSTYRRQSRLHQYPPSTLPHRPHTAPVPAGTFPSPLSTSIFTRNN